MKKGYLLLLFLFSCSYTIIYGQESPDRKGMVAINRNVIQSQLEFLSSDWMEGRRSGEKGELMSSDYIASMLMLYGVKPWGDLNRATLSDNSPGSRSYFQNFSLVKSTAGTEQSFELKLMSDGFAKSNAYAYNADFFLRPSVSGEIEAPVVFAGYGFINMKTGFNNLDGIDIKNKFVLSISGIPAFAESKLSLSEINSSVREFENMVRSKGAAGLIYINPNLVATGGRMPDMSPAERTPRPYQVYSGYTLRGDESAGNTPVITITMKVANDILDGTGNSIEEYRKNADSNKPYTFKPVDGKTLIVKTSVLKEIVPVRNILGIIEGNNKDEYIVLGAHYDHMGMNNGYLWNGADDNGSGTVGVMTLAKAIIETGKKPEKNIIIALWTAEEQGLLGSEYFVKNLNVPTKQIRLNVNFDMISRYIAEDQKSKVVMTYTSSEKSFREMTASNLKKYGIDLNVEYVPSDDPPGGSDHRSFVAAGIPVMRFKPGHREEYHTPKDEISTIDWDIMEKIIKISFANIWQLADSNW